MRAFAGRAFPRPAFPARAFKPALIAVPPGGGANHWGYWARWVKDRRKLEEELRRAADAELQAAIELAQEVRPAEVRRVIAKAKPSPSLIAQPDYEIIRIRFAAKLAKILVTAIETRAQAEEIQALQDERRRMQEEEELLMFLLMV